jgi:hypothetical protein
MKPGMKTILSTGFIDFNEDTCATFNGRVRLPVGDDGLAHNMHSRASKSGTQVPGTRGCGPATVYRYTSLHVEFCTGGKVHV